MGINFILLVNNLLFSVSEISTLSTTSSNALSAGAITGIVIGSIAGATLIASAIYYWLTRRNKKIDDD